MSDWIKMRCNLSSHPKVVKLASRLSVTRVTVIGALHAVWTVADQHATENGLLEMDAESLDVFAETPGFCRELEAVGWLEIGADFVKFPEYHEHNGTTAKTRASAQKRQRKSRRSVTPVTVDRDASVTREEERREELPPIVPQGTTEAGTRPKQLRPPTIQEVADYCAERHNGINPQDFVDHYTACGWRYGSGTGKPLKDWKAAIRTWEARRRNEEKPNQSPARAAEKYAD